MPIIKPSAAGRTAHLPLSADISIAGMISDHTEAATITPEAKPSRVFCNNAGISFFIKKTNAEPVIVPSRGSNNPKTVPFINDLFCLQK